MRPSAAIRVCYTSEVGTEAAVVLVVLCQSLTSSLVGLGCCLSWAFANKFRPRMLLQLTRQQILVLCAWELFIYAVSMKKEIKISFRKAARGKTKLIYNADAGCLYSGSGVIALRIPS